MEIIVFHDKRKGFSLLELLVALLILAIILLGILGALSLSYKKNLQNVLRDEAVRIAQEAMESFRNDGACLPSPLIRQVRNYDAPFSITCNSTTVSNSTVLPEQLIVTVSWEDPGGRGHSITMVSYVE